MRVSTHRGGERAQSGIGTLIILIAAILVATIAVGVFFDIAGLLEGKSQTTSEDINQQFTNQLEIVTVSGRISGDTVDLVNVTVKPASDSGTADLRDVVVRWIGPDGARTYTWAGSETAGPNFTVTVFGDAGETTLSDETDYATLTLDPTDGGTALAEGETATVTLISSSEVTYRLRVPRPLPGKASVEL